MTSKRQILVPYYGLGLLKAVALTALLMLGIILAFDLGRSNFAARRTAKGIGRVTKAHKEVKLRANNSPIFENISEGQEILDRDYVFTGPDAAAEIRLDDGGVIDLGENSLVMVEQQQKADTFKLTLRRGSLEGRASAERALELNIAGRGSSIDLQGGRMQLAKGKDGSASLMVLEGQASIKNGNTPQLMLRSNQVSAILGDGSLAKPRTLPLSLKRPGHNAKVVEELGGVGFAWSKLGELGQISLQISLKPDFAHLLWNENVTGLSNKSIKLKPGRYHWRVLYQDNKGAREGGEVRTLDVQDSAPPRLIEPANGAELTHAPHKFSWTNTSSQGSTLELSRDRNFATPLHSLSNPASPLHLASLSLGQYYWRVVAKDHSGSQRFSDTWSFRVATPLPISSPRLVSPQAEASVALTGAGQLSFAWQNVTKISTYVLEMARDQDFSAGLAQKRVTGTSANLKAPGLGTYYWRVRSVDQTGLLSDKAESRRIFIKGAAPAPLLPKPGARLALGAEKTLHFSWGAQPWTKSYRLELASKDREEKPLVQVELEAARYEWQNARDGTYTWRVAMQDETGEWVYSESRQVEVSSQSNIKAPVLPAHLDVSLEGEDQGP